MSENLLLHWQISCQFSDHGVPLMSPLGVFQIFLAIQVLKIQRTTMKHLEYPRIQDNKPTLIIYFHAISKK